MPNNDIEDTLKRPPTDEEIELVQYMRPNGHKRRVFAPCTDKELVQMSRKQILSVEVLTNGNIAVYSRRQNESEECEHIEISPNGPEVDEALRKCIIAKTIDAKHKPLPIHKNKIDTGNKKLVD